MKIVVRKGTQITTIRDLSGDILYFGRSKKNEVVLADVSVSRRHAKIFKMDDRIYVEDLKSANGTFVNGDKIDRREIKLMDSIEIGDFQVTVEPPDSESLNATISPQSLGEVTFAEATTDLGAGRHAPESDNFMDAIAVRPNSGESTDLKVLKNFLDSAAPPSPGELLPIEKKARLVRLDGPEVGDSVELSKPHISLGRSAKNDVVVEEPSVARAHAVIENVKGTFVLHNQDEKTSTFVDGVPIQERELENHDIVQIGEAHFEFVEGTSRSRAESPRVLERPAERAVTNNFLHILELAKVWLADWRVLPFLGVVLGLTIFLIFKPSSPEPHTVNTHPPTQSDNEAERLTLFHLDRARELYAEKKYDEAESRLNVILEKLSPDHPEAIALLAEVRKERDAQEASEPNEVEVEEIVSPSKSSKGLQKNKKTQAAELKRLYQDGVLKFESGDLMGAEASLKPVAADKKSSYRKSAQKLLAEIKKQSAQTVSKKLRSIQSTYDSGDISQAYVDVKHLKDAFPNNPDVKNLYAKIETDAEAKARKAYMEGITFLEVVEDRPAALERFKEVVKLAPPGSRYQKKAKEKIAEIGDSPEAP